MVPAGPSADCEDGYYQPVIDDTGQSAMIKIDVPTEVSRDEPRFPKEKMKTFYCELQINSILFPIIIEMSSSPAFVILVINFILTTTSLSLVHERLPDRTKYGPLPDIVLDNISEVDWALDVSEVLIMIQMNSCVVLIAFHKHRWGN